MTNWLKWRLGALIGATLLGGVGYLSAQSNYPPPAKTPEEAGQLFFQLLRFGKIEENPWGSDFDWDTAATYKGAISRAQSESFPTPRSSAWSPLWLPLFALLAKEGLDTPSGKGGPGARSVPPSRPPEREVVVVAEDGGYRVDLKATLGRWNNWSGQQLDLEWFKLTGVMAPSLNSNPNARLAQCQMNMKQQMMGIIQYVQDYDEKFPPAREWVDVVMPYVKSEEVFQCPSLSGGKNGYAFSQYFSRVSAAQIEEVARAINIYETSNPKRNWFGPGTGRAYRHQDGWNLAFSDGHVKWYKQGQPTDALFTPTLPHKSQP